MNSKLTASMDPEAIPVSWRSSNTGVATVNSNGTVSAKTAGTAKITAYTADYKTADCMVTVKTLLTEDDQKDLADAIDSAVASPSNAERMDEVIRSLEDVDNDSLASDETIMDKIRQLEKKFLDNKYAGATRYEGKTGGIQAKGAANAALNVPFDGILPASPSNAMIRIEETDVELPEEIDSETAIAADISLLILDGEDESETEVEIPVTPVILKLTIPAALRERDLYIFMAQGGRNPMTRTMRVSDANEDLTLTRVLIPEHMEGGTAQFPVSAFGTFVFANMAVTEEEELETAAIQDVAEAEAGITVPGYDVEAWIELKNHSLVRAAKSDTGSSGNSTGGSSGSSSGSSSSKKYNPASSVKRTAGSWAKDANGWRFLLTNGMPYAGGWTQIQYNDSLNWYWFDVNGYMKTGWLNLNGTWFYLHKAEDGNSGRMYTGWNQIDGVWYYFEPQAGNNQGHLYVNTVTPDGYKVDENGAWVR